MPQTVVSDVYTFYQHSTRKGNARKMKHLTLMLSALMLLAITGCCSIEMSLPGSMKGIEVVDAPYPADRIIVMSNSGLYLLFLFDFSGDIRWNAEKNDINGGIAWHKYLSSPGSLYNTMNHIAVRENACLSNVLMQDTSRLDFSPTSYAGAIMGLMGMNHNCASAVLCPIVEKNEK